MYTVCECLYYLHLIQMAKTLDFFMHCLKKENYLC